MTIRNTTYTLSALIIIFLLITFLVVGNNSFIISIDEFINNFFVNNQSPAFSELMFSITKICNLFEALMIFIVFGIFLYIKHVKHSCLFAVTTFLAAISPYIVKSLVVRARPSILLEQDYSFPSTHATLATVFLLSSIFLIAPHIRRWFSRNLFITITSVIFPLVAFSRIYIGVHWTSDVLAGIVLGSICFVSSHLLPCYKKENVL